MIKHDRPRNDANIDHTITKAIEAAVRAAFVHTDKLTEDALKSTECRLQAYPILNSKIEADKKKLQRLLEADQGSKDLDVERMQACGVALESIEALKALITALKITIAIDEFEIESVEQALRFIREDPYSIVITGKWLDNMNDDEIAAIIPCDASTVRRNRSRLIKKIAVWLHGAQAI
jgi:hypothetical protein